MVHSDSHISMISLRLILLFTPVDDIFDEMHVMASRDLVKVLNKYLL